MGDIDTVIHVVDANGVAMVAIQALCRRITDLEQALAELTGTPPPPPTGT